MSTGHPDWNAVLGHELRTPVAAILGYQELLEDDTLGPLPQSAAEALRRIRLAADQLITLIDAIEGSWDGQDPAPFSARDILDDAARSVRFEAEGRDTTIAIGAANARLLTRRADACRALTLILGAAVKVTPGGSIHVAADDLDVPRFILSGSNLHPDRDHLDPDRPLSGAGLRLELARAAARRIDGRLDLLPDGVVHLRLPRLPTP